MDKTTAFRTPFSVPCSLFAFSPVSTGAVSSCRNRIKSLLNYLMCDDYCITSCHYGPHIIFATFESMGWKLIDEPEIDESIKRLFDEDSNIYVFKSETGEYTSFLGYMPNLEETFRLSLYIQRNANE